MTAEQLSTSAVAGINQHVLEELEAASQEKRQRFTRSASPAGAVDEWPAIRLVTCIRNICG